MLFSEVVSVSENPHSQKKLEEQLRQLNEQERIEAEKGKKGQDKRWRIYAEIKSWLPITISLAALIVSILALLRTG